MSNKNKTADNPLEQLECHGSATLGERGQVVIPAELREELGLEGGDKMIVFSTPVGSVMFISAEEFEEMVSKWGQKLEEFKELS